MDWLTHNPVADMSGPTFLAFYLASAAAVVAACRVARGALDWTHATAPPAVPVEPDPHEVAYLRGGENEVARSVIFALVQKGLLAVRQEGSEFVVAPAGAAAERRTLSPIERRTLDWFAGPQKVSKLFKADGLAPHLRPFCAAYEQRLRRENLLPTVEMLSRARWLRRAGVLLVGGLGFYKGLMAVSRGRFNLWFLAALAVVAVFAVVRVTRTPRLTRRGRAYLERLRLAFERLKNRAVDYGPAVNAVRPSAPGVAGGDGAVLAAYDPALPLLVGVFGVAALAGTQYDYFNESFRRSASGHDASSSGGGCGASCGSSGSSSSDSSSSDGSSGDGGGGCGGGGCGGCGS